MTALLIISETEYEPTGGRLSKSALEKSDRHKRTNEAATANSISVPHLEIASMPLYEPYKAAADINIGKTIIETLKPELSDSKTVNIVIVMHTA